MRMTQRFARQTPHSSRMRKILVILALTSCHCMQICRAFVPTTPVISTSLRTKEWTTSPTPLFSNENDSILDRFTSPKLDDPWLPFTEAGLAQIVAPSFQLFFLSSANSPFPSWAQPFFTDLYFVPRGSFLAPTLIHGAGLACCWLLGSLAAECYSRDNFEGGFGTVVWSTAKAGAFACGLLILATQFDLYTEMGGYVQVGDSVETDLRIYRALVEVINDIVFEAITLLTWRLYRSKV